MGFTWHGKGEPAPTAVSVTLTSDGEQTHVVVKHSGFGAGDAWAETIRALQAAWPMSLENLNAIMTSGEDLRFTKRPMLGVIISDFNAEIAAQLGVPVDEGIRLDDVVEEMGAKAAGLEANDVVVAMAGQEVVDWSTLQNALQPHRAGDTIAVTFYRGAEKHTVQMPLSGRPLPEIPETPAALAAIVEERHAEVEAELESFLADVAATEAAFKPAPEEWSVKETLAHLVQSERDWHNWMANMIGGHEAWYDDWGGNVPARITATMTAYPQVADLLAELKRHHTETAVLVANLPDDFVARRSTYWRLAYNLLEAPYHHRAHMAQMETAVAQAREAVATA